MSVAVQALTSIVTDSSGTPLFQAQMAAAGLPVSAAVGDTVYLPGVSVTDQISSYHPLSSKASAGKIAGIVIGSVACIALIATVLGLICLCRRKRQGIFTHQKVSRLICASCFDWVAFLLQLHLCQSRFMSV